jgi:hypothetical protein
MDFTKLAEAYDKALQLGIIEKQLKSNYEQLKAFKNRHTVHFKEDIVGQPTGCQA